MKCSGPPHSIHKLYAPCRIKTLKWIACSQCCTELTRVKLLKLTCNKCAIESTVSLFKIAQASMLSWIKAVDWMRKFRTTYQSSILSWDEHFSIRKKCLQKLFMLECINVIQWVVRTHIKFSRSELTRLGGLEPSGSYLESADCQDEEWLPRE